MAQLRHDRSHTKQIDYKETWNVKNYDRQISAQGTQKIVMDDKYSSLTSACFAVVPLMCRKLRIIMSWNCGFENQIDTKNVNLQFGGMSLTLMLDTCVQ